MEDNPKNEKVDTDYVYQKYDGRNYHSVHIKPRFGRKNEK